jgi:hypothetical protein
LKRPTKPSTLEPQLERQTAVELFNFAWTLLEKGDRSLGESELMLHAAHASRFHWEEPGEPVNHARGEWQISRVYAVLGRAEPALHHAKRCLDLCTEHGIGDFDLAYAYEALARAHAVANEPDSSRRFAELARQTADGIADAEDREHFLEDLATIP